MTMIRMRVLKPGAYSVVQDGGRGGLQRYGISPGGAMDRISYRLANRLVGNRGDVAAMECTVVGPSLEMEGDTLIAVCGADMRPTIDGGPLPMNRPVHVRAGSVLAFGGAVAGFRAYLAVAGGFDVPRLLGGRGAYPAAGLAGVLGRALVAGDTLHVARQPSLAAVAVPARWSVSTLFPMPERGELVRIRAVAGPELDRLSESSRRALFERRFVVDPRSDRMGYRLSGPRMEWDDASQLVSEAVTFGTVQLPIGGDPILLMADRQTTGGYPRLLQVIAADLPMLAQCGPGAAIRFDHVSLQEAVSLLKDMEFEMRMRERFVALRLRELRSEGVHE